MKEHIVIEKKVKVGRIRNWSRRKKLLVASFIVSLLLILVSGVAVVAVMLPAQKVYNSLQSILSVVDNVRVDLESKDLTNLDGHVAQINQELSKIDSELQQFEFLKDVEFTKGYYDNLKIVREIANKGESLLNESLPELKTLLGSIGYTVDDKVDEKPGEEDQVFALVREMPRVLGIYNDSEAELLELVDLFNQIDPNYIPAIGTGGTKEKVAEMQKFTQQFPSVSAQVKTTLRQLPELLGSEKPTNYLIIMQNEKEMRASGGLLTSYGLLTIDKGEIVGDINVTDMWDLELFVSSSLGIDAGYRNIYGQLYLMLPHESIKYGGCGAAYLRAQDSGIYPDLNLTANMITDYYDIANAYAPQRYPGYDHVIIFNTFFASDMVELIEPVVVPDHAGQPITSANLAKEIFAETSNQPLDPATRKAFIGEVATVAKEKLVDLSSDKFPDIIQKLIRTIQAKNIAFYSEDADMQAYFDELGLSGRQEQNFAGDYFHLNEAQVCSLKSNFYVRNSVTQTISINSAGKINKAVKVNWWNNKIYDPNEDKILSNKINFAYRAWVRVFAPPGSQFVESDGLTASGYLYYYPQEYFDDQIQKQISDNIIWFDHRRFGDWDPVKRQELNVKYTLPDSIKYSDAEGYRMLIQKHPGKENEKYTININHEGNITSTEFVLDRDKVVTYRRGVLKVENYDTRLDQYFSLMDQLRGL